MNQKLAHLIVGALAFISLNSTAAGSLLVLPELASVDGVSLKIFGGYAYQKIPGLEPASFNNLVQDLVEANLLRCGLRLDKSSSIVAYIVIEGARSQGDHVAFAVSVELREPAVLERLWPQQEARGPSVPATTWRKTRILLAEQEDAEWRLMQTIVSLFEHFIGRVSSARQTFSNTRVPDECFEDAPSYPDYEKILADWKLKTKSGPASPQ